MSWNRCDFCRYEQQHCVLCDVCLADGLLRYDPKSFIKDNGREQWYECGYCYGD